MLPHKFHEHNHLIKYDILLFSLTGGNAITKLVVDTGWVTVWGPGPGCGVETVLVIIVTSNQVITSHNHHSNNNNSSLMCGECLESN